MPKSKFKCKELVEVKELVALENLRHKHKMLEIKTETNGKRDV